MEYIYIYYTLIYEIPPGNYKKKNPIPVKIYFYHLLIYRIYYYFLHVFIICFKKCTHKVSSSHLRYKGLMMVNQNHQNM
jgi:hypothetical protein